MTAGRLFAATCTSDGSPVRNAPSAHTAGRNLGAHG
jgi:hypothetical protein